MSDLVCCIYCGRDTKNKCGICGLCLSGRRSFARRGASEKGRKSRHYKEYDYDEEPDEETSDTRFHGDNYEP